MILIDGIKCALKPLTWLMCAIKYCLHGKYWLRMATHGVTHFDNHFALHWYPMMKRTINTDENSLLDTSCRIGGTTCQSLVVMSSIVGRQRILLFIWWSIADYTRVSCRIYPLYGDRIWRSRQCPRDIGFSSGSSDFTVENIGYSMYKDHCRVAWRVGIKERSSTRRHGYFCLCWCG